MELSVSPKGSPAQLFLRGRQASIPLLMPPGGFSLSPWAGKEETGFSIRRGLRQALGAPWGAGWPLRTQETSGGSCRGPGVGNTIRGPQGGCLRGGTLKGTHTSKEGTVGREWGWGDTPQSLYFLDGVGIGAQTEVNSFQLCHFVFLTTLPPVKGTFPGTCCSIPWKGSNWFPSASNKVSQ